MSTYFSSAVAKSEPEHVSAQPPTSEFCPLSKLSECRMKAQAEVRVDERGNKGSLAIICSQKWAPLLSRGDFVQYLKKSSQFKFDLSKLFAGNFFITLF